MSWRTVYLDFRTKIGGSVLHDRKSQACTADFPGMTFIHPEEAFKNPLLKCRWNTNAGIRYAYCNFRIRLRNSNSHAPALPVIFDSVIKKIK